MKQPIFEERVVIDALEGDVYLLTELHLAGSYDFVKMGKRGPVELKNRETNQPKTITFREFARMRGEGTAVRTVREGVPTACERLTAFHMLDPREKGLSVTERAKRERAARKVQRAMTLHFYARRFDCHPTATTYERKLESFIRETFPDALSMGLADMPTTSPLRKALAKYGKPGNRPLGQFIDLRGKHSKSSRWFDWVLELKEKMIDAYWKPKANKDVVKSVFLESFHIQRAARGVSDDYKPPSDTALNDWLNLSENQDRVAEKEGRRNAHKRYVGTIGSLVAARPLQYVILDQTEIDIGLHIKNTAGELIRVQRAWLVYAMDVYSRMILGFFLTLEPPSIFSLMKCIKQVIRVKTDWELEFGSHKGATDGWGWFNWLILDNGLENVGVSLRTAMAKLGVDIMYAALRTPEHKAQLERTFGITNSLWHKLPGGIPGGPEARRKMAIDPISDAKLTLEEARRKLTGFLVTCYHVEDPRGRRLAPARKWAEGILQHGRRTLDDARALSGLLGKYHRAVLTTSGIHFEGEEFHEHAAVTGLLRDLLRLQLKRIQRDEGQTGVCRVNVFFDPMDCSEIFVLNDATGQLIRIPNKYQDACIGLSFDQSKAVRAYARQQALEWHTVLDRAIARNKLFGNMVASAIESGKATKKQTRFIHAEQIALNPEAEFEETFEEPSASGLKKRVPNTAPASRGLDHGVAPMGVARGGKRKSAGASYVRKGNQDSAELSRAKVPEAAVCADAMGTPVDYFPEPDETEDLEEAMAFMASLGPKQAKRW